jgi:hypothetical protein
VNPCGHQQLAADVKASIVDGRYFLCLRVWCWECLIDFEITDESERSIDWRQMLTRVQPAALTMVVSDANN